MRLILESLSFRYPRAGTAALTDVTASFDSNLIAVLGPNGAGKTTLLNILATHSHPTSGGFGFGGLNSRIRGDRDRMRRSLGWLPQSLDMMKGYTAAEFLRYVAWMREVPLASVEPSVADALALVDLSEHADRRIKALSGGMRQRLGIAQAIVNEPTLVILDEPTVGLDPQQRMDFRDRIAQLAHDRLVVLSTHLVEDVASVAHEVLIIAEGQVHFAGSLSELCRMPGDETPSGSDIETAYLRLMSTLG